MGACPTGTVCHPPGLQPAGVLTQRFTRMLLRAHQVTCVACWLPWRWAAGGCVGHAGLEDRFWLCLGLPSGRLSQDLSSPCLSFPNCKSHMQLPSCELYDAMPGAWHIVPSEEVSALRAQCPPAQGGLGLSTLSFLRSPALVGFVM